MWPQASLLPDGTVLIVGENPAEIFDPVSSTFALTGTMISNVYRFGTFWHTATSLSDGKVLVTGGNDDMTCGGFANAEVYDPSTGAFQGVGHMTTPRDIHTATLLRDGTVLIAGGGDGWCGAWTYDTAELYNPATRSFLRNGAMTESRSGHTATLLNDGTVLLAGGFSYWPCKQLRSAELYRPIPPRTRAVRR